MFSVISLLHVEALTLENVLNTNSTFCLKFLPSPYLTVQYYVTVRKLTKTLGKPIFLVAHYGI